MSNHTDNPRTGSPKAVTADEMMMPVPDEKKGWKIGEVSLFEPLDIGIWVGVLLFFSISSLVGGGDMKMSLVGALGVIFIMFFVGISVELIIESLKDVKGLGTLVGFITNGPEGLCLVVGLISGNILFAASTPLGSNFMNPVMLIISSLITANFLRTIKTHPLYTVTCILITASFAGGFFFIPSSYYLLWAVVTLVVSAILFRLRPDEPSEDEDAEAVSRVWFIPAFVVLIVAGYLLDPVVSFSAEHSHAPKGVIGFFVLSALTSWPEFKSCISLFRRGRPLAAVLNITVSNITNIWLAIGGILVYLMM